MGAAAPLVSVCVVHHDRGPLLLQTLESVRKQTLPLPRPSVREKLQSRSRRGRTQAAERPREVAEPKQTLLHLSS